MSADDWQRLRPVIERALPHCHGTHTIEDIEAGLASGRYLFWGGERSAIITEIVEFPQFKALNFALIGGELKELRLIAAQVEADARKQNCKRLMGSGRKGWARVLPDFRPLSVTYGKDL